MDPDLEQLLPRSIIVDPHLTPFNTTSVWPFSDSSTLYPYNGRRVAGLPSQVLEYKVLLQKGTYSMNVISSGGDNLGNIDWTVGNATGTLIITTGTSVPVKLYTVTGIVVSATGIQTLKFINTAANCTFYAASLTKVS
jgi:hypothetical protein